MQKTNNRPDIAGVDAIRSLEYFIDCPRCKYRNNVGELMDVNHKIRFRRWITCEACKAVSVILGIRADQEKNF